MGHGLVLQILYTPFTLPKKTKPHLDHHQKQPSYTSRPFKSRSHHPKQLFWSFQAKKNFGTNLTKSLTWAPAAAARARESYRYNDCTCKKHHVRILDPQNDPYFTFFKVFLNSEKFNFFSVDHSGARASSCKKPHLSSFSGSWHLGGQIYRQIY